MRVSTARVVRSLFLSTVVVAMLVGGTPTWGPALSFAWGATPTSGTISDAGGSLSWSGSTLTTLPQFSSGTCQTAGNCDVFTLTIALSSAYRQANPNFTVFVRIDWGSNTHDYDLYIRRVMPDGTTAAVDNSGNGFTTFEEVMLRQPADGTYRVYAHAWAVVPGTPYSGRITLSAVTPEMALRSATYQKDPDGKFGAQMFQFTSDLRLVGSNDLAGSSKSVEPDIEINRFGTIYAAAIQGVPAGTDFWRSRNGGDTFEFLGQPDGTQRAANLQRGGAGGGDNDISLGAPFVLLDVPNVGKVDSSGRVYVSSLWLGSSTVATSFTEGDAFTVSQLPIPIHDRQWNASAGTSRVYATARQLGALVVGTTSLFVVQSDDGGLTFPRGGFITLMFTTDGKERLQGNIEAFPEPGAGDPANSAVYNVYSGALRTELFVAKCPAPCTLPLLLSNGTVDASKKPFIIRQIFRAPAGGTVDNVFPVVAVDSASGIHVAFSDKRNVYLLSSSDGGETWTNPVRVNNPADPDLKTSLFPWIFAGDSGRVGVMWYGTNRAGDADSETDFSGAEWKVYYALTTNAFASSPTFQYLTASGMRTGSDRQTRGVVHVGSICTRGLDCNLSTPPGNRNLAEYASNTGDPQGFANILYAGDVSTPNGLARAHFVKQISGPSVLAGAIVTGGGSIGNGSAVKEFSVHVKRRTDGTLTGDLTFLDESAHLLLKSSTITGLSITGARATISGRGTLQNGATVTFTVEAADNGSPGMGNDTFAITISTGYAASGTLTGGNVKMH